MALESLFSKRPILSLDEIRECLDRGYSRNKRSQESLLSYYLGKGRLIRIRRGLYAVVPPGTDPRSRPIDPYLVAGKSVNDAVVAYHTALELHGKAHSFFETFYFQSTRKVAPIVVQGNRFVGKLFPKPLRNKGKEFFATTKMERAGIEIRATTLERTLVDLHARPDLGGDWEEVWRSLESVEYFDLDLIVEYVELLGNHTTAAKVGYFLERHAGPLMVEGLHLDRLRALRPKRPHYVVGGRGGTFVGNWNLVVPKSLVETAWEEPT